MNISVVICAYSMERWDELTVAVRSCLEQTRKPHEVIVVIDHNEELRARACEVLSGAVVTVNESAKGLSGARNAGVALASGDVIAFLDDDAYADDEWLEQLVRPLSDAKVAGVGGWIIPHWPGEVPAEFPETFYWVFGCSYLGLPSDGARIRNPIGANMALRKRVFESVGGFTSELGRIGKIPLGGEETELCIRYHHDHPDEYFVLARDAVVHHRVPESRLTFHYFWTRCWAEGLSKAGVASLAGADVSLAAERKHLARALPREVLKSLRVIAREPRAGVARLAMMVVGTGCAIAGFLWGQRSLRRSGDATLGVTRNPAGKASDEWRPIALLEVPVENLDEGLSIPTRPGERVWIEVKRQGQIVGVLETQSETSEVSLSALREAATTFSEVAPSALGSLPNELLAKASVVVPTICENSEELVSVVETLLALDYPDFEVIIVDNRSNSNKVSLPALPDDARLLVVEEASPGISAARNRGIAVATGQFIAFTDDDVVVDRNWLRALGARFALDASVDFIGGLVLPAELDTVAQLWFEEFYGGFTRSFQATSVSLEDHDVEDELFPYNVGRFGAGCNMALRRSALDRWGGFDTSLGVGTPAKGGEDLAMFMRLLLAGATLAFEPAALVRHYHRRTKREFMHQVRSYGVGLGAFYVSLVAHDPRQLWAMSKRVPVGIRRLVRPRTQRSISSTPSYPRRTLLYQMLGLAFGPVAYVRSVMRSRRFNDR